MKLRQRIGLLRRTRRLCVVCAKFGMPGYVPRGWAFDEPDGCTCGAGGGVTVLHDLLCDAVPCPFCRLR